MHGKKEEALTWKRGVLRVQGTNVLQDLGRKKPDSAPQFYLISNQTYSRFSFWVTGMFTYMVCKKTIGSFPYIPIDFIHENFFSRDGKKNLI